MKLATKQQKCKQFYLGTSTSVVYHGTRTQPGYAGLRAGLKMRRKANRNRLDSMNVGIVSKAYENIAKGKR